MSSPIDATNPSLVRRVDAAVRGVAELADTGATGRAQIEVIGLLVGEDLVQHDGRVPLHDLDVLAVQLDDVVDRVGVELQVLVHRVARVFALFAAKPNGSSLRRKIARHPTATNASTMSFPAGKARPRDRRERLDPVVVRVQAHLAVAVVDLLHPLHEQLVAVTVLERSGSGCGDRRAVEARADLDPVARRNSSRSSSISERFVTSANERIFFASTFFRVAYSTMCRSTSQFAVGSPPWNSIVIAEAVDLEGEVDAALRDVDRHVGVGALHADDRAVAVLAPVVAPLRQHEAVQRGAVEEVMLLALPAFRLHLDVDACAMKFAFRSRSYSGSPGCGRPSMKDSELLGLEQQPVAELVGDEDLPPTCAG